MLRSNERQLRAGLVFKARGLVVSLNSRPRVIKKKKFPSAKASDGGWVEISHTNKQDGVPPLGRWIHDFALRVSNFGCRILGSGFGVQVVQGSRSRVEGSRFRVQGSVFEVQGSGFKVKGSRFKVQGAAPRPPSAHERWWWPVHFIITMIKWIQTSRLSIKNSRSVRWETSDDAEAWARPVRRRVRVLLVGISS